METGLPCILPIVVQATQKGAAVFRGKAVLKTQSMDPAPGIESATTRSAVKRSTDYVTVLSVTFKTRENTIDRQRLVPFRKRSSKWQRPSSKGRTVSPTINYILIFYQ